MKNKQSMLYKFKIEFQFNLYNKFYISKNMSKKKPTVKNLQNITEVASAAEVSNHRRNNGQKMYSNEGSQNLRSSNNTTMLRGQIGADGQRPSKMSEPYNDAYGSVRHPSVNAGPDERNPTVTRNFKSDLVQAGQTNDGAGQMTGRNLDNTPNSKDSGRHTGFKSYDTTKMPIGTDKDELKDIQQFQSMDYTDQILKSNEENYSLDKYANNSQSHLELPPRKRVNTQHNTQDDADEDVAEEEKSQENTGDRQTGEGHSMSKSKIHDQTQQDLTKDASVLTKMRILENSSAANSAIMSPAGYQHQSAMNSYNASRSPSPGFNQIGQAQEKQVTKTPLAM